MKDSRKWFFFFIFGLIILLLIFFLKYYLKGFSDQSSNLNNQSAISEYALSTSTQYTSGMVHYKIGDPNAAQGVGLNGVRKENDDVMTFPTEKANEVYAYLKEKYYSHNDFLKEQFPDLNLTTQIEEDIFTDDYFDTPNLDLLNKENLIRHRSRNNLTNIEDRKNGRELVQMKLSHDVNNAEVRDELKWHVASTYKKGQNSLEEISPLIRIIQTKERADFERATEQLDISPYSLKKILTLFQHRKRLYVNWDGLGIITFSVDDAIVRRLWARVEFVDMEQQLSEIAYTQADEATRIKEVAIRQTIIKDLKDHFPFIQVSKSPKYNTVFELLEKNIPFLRTLIRWNIL